MELLRPNRRVFRTVALALESLPDEELTPGADVLIGVNAMTVVAHRQRCVGRGSPGGRESVRWQCGVSLGASLKDRGLVRDPQIGIYRRPRRRSLWLCRAAAASG